ncbi:MAG: ethylbenzene dehydrogenase-related protein [Haloarculaceae archaeon]
MTDRSRQLTAALAAVVLLGTVVGTMVAAGRPAGEIHVEAVDSADYAAPGHAGWQDVPARTVALTAAPSGLPQASNTTVTQARVQAAETDSRLYVRVSWADATVDRNESDPRQFADAVALEMPVNASGPQPPIAMGSNKNMVDVWYWSGSTGSQELLAGGAATLTEFQSDHVATQVRRDGGQWQVVFARNLSAPGANRTALDGQQDVPVALAVWNGSNMERSGRKAVSTWQYFPLGPGLQGPPLQTLFWALAGLALVAIVLVTIRSVSNGIEVTGGE